MVESAPLAPWLTLRPERTLSVDETVGAAALPQPGYGLRLIRSITLIGSPAEASPDKAIALLISGDEPPTATVPAWCWSQPTLFGCK